MSFMERLTLGSAWLFTCWKAGPARNIGAMPDRPFERLVFDCDSTLARIEGVEELSLLRGPEVRTEIARLTEAAMSGEVPLQEVFGRRLELVAPRRNDVATIGRRYIEEAVPGVRETFAALRSLDKELRIVSGGLRLAVVAFANWLGVPDERVHAVQTWFDADGRLLRFDLQSPLVRRGGKREVLAALPAARTALIGDGMTDAEAADLVDCFVAFGGVRRRPAVEALAHVIVPGPNFAALLPELLTAAELDRLRRDPRHRALVETATA